MLDDADVPRSDAWWMVRLATKLSQQAVECEALHCRYRGEYPLPNVHRNVEEAVRDYLRKARTNWERLAVQGPLPRMKIVGIRTAVEGDVDGDALAYGRWTGANMKLVVHETHKNMFTMRLGFVVVGADTDGKLLVTSEDPREITAEVDPANPYRTLAAFSLKHDPIAGEDVARLFLAGRVQVAKRKRKANPDAQGRYPVPSFSPKAYEWDEDRSGATLTAGNPVHVFPNEDGQAEFEPHLPILDRITDNTVQRMTIALAQAFKQRAIKGVPQKDADGNPVDYNELLRADPMSVWLLPMDAEIWESTQAEMQGILLANRDDLKDYAAVSGTPLYSITPDAANGSAEGASLQRESLTFKTEAHIERVDPSWEAVAADVLQASGMADRAARESLDIIWASVERFSLSERANAVAQTKDVVPVRTQLTDIMGYSPTDANRMMTELQDDQLRKVIAQAGSSGNGAG